MAAVTITVILEPKKIKSVTASAFSPSVCHEVMRPDAMILIFWTLSFKPVFSYVLKVSSNLDGNLDYLGVTLYLFFVQGVLIHMDFRFFV